jgi:D-proline reductase (dithiol) PrdD
MDEVLLRRLVIRSFHITDVVFSGKTCIKGSVLSIDNSVVDRVMARNPLIAKMTTGIIRPYEHSVKTNTIMDIIPISTKVLGKLGEGITHTLTGVYCVLTGCDEDGRQMHEFGSSDGILGDQIFFGRAGTPEKSDFILHIDFTLKGGQPFDRNLVNAAFQGADLYLQEIRESLKTNEYKEASETHEFFDRARPGKKRVALVRQVAGQGAMYDNQLFSNEPSGYAGGISIINMSNVPIMLSANEYRDGALRAMT